MPIRLITLDLDDTLWPMLPLLVGADQRMRAWLADRLGGAAQVPSPERMRELRAGLVAVEPALAHQPTRMRRAVLQAALRETCGAAVAQHLADDALEVFLAARNDVTLAPAVVATLDHLRARYRLAAITNGNADIGRTGLDGWLEFQVSAEVCGVAKPDRAIFGAALARAGLAAAEAVHVGDHPHQDVDGALAAGMHAIWLRGPAPDAAPTRRASAVIDRFEDLPGTLAELEARATEDGPAQQPPG